LESIYERCLLRELELRGIPVLNPQEVVIDYNGTVFKEKLKFDLLADGCFLVELKAIHDVLPIHRSERATTSVRRGCGVARKWPKLSARAVISGPSIEPTARCTFRPLHPPAD
jgi:hypothetical protein